MLTTSSALSASSSPHRYVIIPFCIVVVHTCTHGVEWRGKWRLAGRSRCNIGVRVIIGVVNGEWLPTLKAISLGDSVVRRVVSRWFCTVFGLFLYTKTTKTFGAGYLRPVLCASAQNVRHFYLHLGNDWLCRWIRRRHAVAYLRLLTLHTD